MSQTAHKSASVAGPMPSDHGFTARHNDASIVAVALREKPEE